MTSASAPALASAAPRAAARRPVPPWPWLDHRGRICRLRAPGLLLLIAPGAWLAWQWGAGWLGPEPVKAVLHGTGLWAVRLLLLGLAVTPLARLLAWPQLLYVRRQVGVATFCYALVHLGLYALNENLDLGKVALEILRRPYLTIGFVGLVGLAALAATSTDGAMRRLGKGWKRLHRLAYPIGGLALLHFFLQSKADVSEPVLVTGLFLWLMLWRAVPEGWAARPATPFALAPVAALGAAGIEYAWYALATKLPAGLILAANLEPDLAPRPAHWVLAAGVSVAVLVLARRWLIARR